MQEYLQHPITMHRNFHSINYPRILIISVLIIKLLSHNPILINLSIHTWNHFDWTVCDMILLKRTRMNQRPFVSEICRSISITHLLKFRTPWASSTSSRAPGPALIHIRVNRQHHRPFVPVKVIQMHTPRTTLHLCACRYIGDGPIWR